jgi:hypothetical protein
LCVAGEPDGHRDTREPEHTNDRIVLPDSDQKRGQN